MMWLQALVEAIMDDLEDDLHVCLKCHDQIVGLDNYIEHRRSACRGKPIEAETDDQPAQTETGKSVCNIDILNITLTDK